jgi:hypothetical protein
MKGGEQTDDGWAVRELCNENGSGDQTGTKERQKRLGETDGGDVRYSV